MIAALFGARLDDASLLPKAGKTEAELLSQVDHARAAEVGEFDPLQVGPDAFIRVQIGRVAREVLQVQTGRPAYLVEGPLDWLAAVG